MMGAMLRGAKGEVKLLSASALGRMRRTVDWDNHTNQQFSMSGYATIHLQLEVLGIGALNMRCKGGWFSWQPVASNVLGTAWRHTLRPWSRFPRVRRRSAGFALACRPRCR
jgi:hypothetical protein